MPLLRPKSTKIAPSPISRTFTFSINPLASFDFQSSSAIARLQCKGAIRLLRPYRAYLSQTRLLYHLDESFSDPCRINHFPQECDAGSVHAILGFHANVEAEAIDRGHLSLQRLNAGKPFCEQDERILMVCIHVLDDIVLMLRQRIGLSLGVIRGGYPPHHSEAAHVINIQYVHSVKEEILKIDPVLATWVTRQIGRTRGSQFWLWDSAHRSYQRDSGRTKWVAAGIRLCHKQAGPRVRLQVLGMHGHRADQEDGAPLSVQSVRHQGSKGEARLFPRQGRETGDAAQVQQSACALCKRRFGDGILTRRATRVFSDERGRHC